MARVRELGVWLDGQRVATLRSPKVGRVTCEYTAEVVDGQGKGKPLLSCSLPLRSGRHDAWPFVTGLLPEGQHRSAMAGLARVSTIDLLGMLHRFGRDVAGALIIAADQPVARDATAIPYGDGELEIALSELGSHPLGLYDDSELSLAGLQDKILLVRTPDGSWARPVHGYPSTHILKVDDRFHTGLVGAEHACLSLARAAGLSASRSEIIQVGDAQCIVVERFDRAATGPGEAAVRLHQEDTCQALGIDPDHGHGRGKYEAHGGPTFRQIAGLLDLWSADSHAERLRLLDRATFTVAIGDADAHGKNLAFLHPRPGEITLAPLYDTVPTMAWPRLRVEAAMSIGGVTRLPDVDREALIREGISWELSRPVVAARIDDLLDRLHAALKSDDGTVSAMGMVKSRVELLSGRS
ncbi:HipA domain-containing protein [Catenuloplanes sp. NPDC051500]|uniref:HipA domain-containing protein n=1 Tax=Catenuloplanes sp. NPDC051500 TaxID=3363959 RepID=UPI0037B109C5